MTRKFQPIVSGPDGVVFANYGRYFKEAIAGAFEACGGQPRFNDYANENYPEFARTFLTRMIPKEVELGTTQGVEDLLKQLDAPTIDITPRSGT